MTDYKITLPDGTTVEAPHAHECVEMTQAVEGEARPTRFLAQAARDALNRKQEWDLSVDVDTEKMQEDIEELRKEMHE